MFGRILKASIAKDNGRTTEFIRRKDYPDKTRCYECGEFGHLSYKCSKNILGEREPPPKKVRIRKKGMDKHKLTEEEKQYFESSDEDLNQGSIDDETLSAAIKTEQEKYEIDEYRLKVATGCYNDIAKGQISKRKIKKSTYFSDEEESE